VAPQDACVQGHFPGSPVVPGAYLLGRIDLALRQYLPDRSLRGLDKVKFLAPLLPGQQASICFESAAESRLTVRIIRDGQILLSASALI
jgi:3-hydroxymyristoyl/3-hydroxydecanoyl-(acyl carrier protein) dehydratase